MDIEEILYTFEDDYNPSSMVQGPRNMYNQGQLVQPNADGSRPGYSGIKGKTKKKTLSKEKLKVLDQYSQEIFSKNYDKLTKPDDVSKVYSTAYNRTRGTGAFKYIPTAETNRAPLPKEQKNKLIKFAKANNIKLDFNKYPRFGVPRSIKGKPGNSPTYQKITDSYKNYDFEIFKKDTLPLKQRNFVMDNFELPKGVKKWDFDNFKFGVNSTKYRQLQKRIETKLNGPIKYTIAVDRNSPKGWMTAAMERVYKNETTLLEDGSRVLKKGVNKLTYEPVFKEGTKNIIIGFKDNTPSGQGLTYYGLNKNTPDGAASWSQHKDYNNVAKFIDITERVKEEPSKILQKILDDKGITNLLGKNKTLRLNDILSHERYYDKISEIKPTKLLERQIVKHHVGGVGAGDVARASATRDIQLLTGAVNKKITGFESKLIKDGFLSKADNDILKNLGAKIRGADGKIYGGGYMDPTKQFAAIEKKALDYAKGDQFNVKTVASYLERLGCGKAAGGRILFAEGVPSLTKCAQKGVTKIENGLKNGFKNADDAVLARGILKSGRFLKDAVSLRGLFGPAALAFTAAAEAGLVGYDMLSSGKSFREAIGDSIFNYALGDKTKIDSEEEFIKRLKNIKTGPSGLRDFSDQEIGKMLNFKTNLDDMQKGFSLYNQLQDVDQAILDNKASQDGTQMFPDNAFQLDAEKDRIQADIRDYNKVGTPRKVTDYLLSDAATEGADAAKKAELLARQDQLQDAGIGKIYQSAIGDEKRKKEAADIKFQLEQMYNPTKHTRFGQAFIDATPGEQSYFMGKTDFMEGGIVSLNVKK